MPHLCTELVNMACFCEPYRSTCTPPFSPFSFSSPFFSFLLPSSPSSSSSSSFSLPLPPPLSPPSSSSLLPSGSAHLSGWLDPVVSQWRSLDNYQISDAEVSKPFPSASSFVVCPPPIFLPTFPLSLLSCFLSCVWAGGEGGGGGGRWGGR